MSAPNPNTVPVDVYELGITLELMTADSDLRSVAQGLYKATGERFAQTVESTPQDEYSRDRVVADGLGPLGALAVSEEAALHRMAFARLVHSASSLAVACQVDLEAAFGYIFPHGSFDGTIDQFDAAVVALPDVNDLVITGPFGWLITTTISEDAMGAYGRAYGDFMDTAESALKRQRPPGGEALTRTTGRLLHAVSWILQERLNSSLAAMIRMEQNLS